MPRWTTPWLALGFSSALFIAISCGGKVVVPAAMGTGGAGGAGGMSVASSSEATTQEDVGISVQSSTADGAPCLPCAAAFNGVDYSTLCSAAKSAYKDLYGCGCGPACVKACTGSFCGMPIAMMTGVCLDCLQSSCATKLQACESQQ